MTKFLVSYSCVVTVSIVLMFIDAYLYKKSLRNKDAWKALINSKNSTWFGSGFYYYFKYKVYK